jgi:hypothetical protein
MENQIILYQAEDETTSLEVRLENETVWLNRHQISYLFDRDIKTIGKHINNVFNEKELEKSLTVANFATVQNEGGRIVERQIEYYNLDVIISVGYRVKSKRGTQFRIWANKVLKDFLLKGYAVNHRLSQLENDMHTVKNKLNEFDFHIKTALPPSEGIFFNGQVFDAWVFATDLVKTAKKSIVLIDNYVDEQVLLLLSKRKENVSAKIYSMNLSKQFHLDLKKHNSQYPEIHVQKFNKSHDRFLIIDEQEIYHIGASLKDLGKKWFAFSKMNIESIEILNKLEM